VQGQVARWRQDWRPLVKFQFVWDAKFFAKPDDAFGLGDLEMMAVRGMMIGIPVCEMNLCSSEGTLISRTPGSCWSRSQPLFMRF